VFSFDVNEFKLQISRLTLFVANVKNEKMVKEFIGHALSPGWLVLTPIDGIILLVKSNLIHSDDQFLMEYARIKSSNTVKESHSPDVFEKNLGVSSPLDSFKGEKYIRQL
jgi:hypothetical protein